MNISKMEAVALWLIGLSVPAFMVTAITFGGISPVWVVLASTLCTIFWLVAFPSGVLLLLLSQLFKLLKRWIK